MSWRVQVKARRGDFTLDVELSGSSVPVALVGPNGGGKTTLLRMIAGAIRPDSGEIKVSGERVFHQAFGAELPSHNVPSEERNVGYVPQGNALFPHLSVLDNVAFGLSVGSRKQSRVARQAAARAVLKELKCEHLSDQATPQLSGGERQRVALARALVVLPKLLLLDEPLAALDVAVRRVVRHSLAERIVSASQPTLLVTHDARDVAAFGAHVCVLEAGRIVQRGSLAELRAKPLTSFVAEFVADIMTGSGR